MKKLSRLICMLMVMVLLAGCGKTDYKAEYQKQKKNEKDTTSVKEDSSDNVVNQDEKVEELDENVAEGEDNANAPSTERYMSFLANEENVYTDKFEGYRYEDYVRIPFFDNQSKMSLNSFFAYIVAKVNGEYDNAPLEKLQYAFIDCGEDGKPELALRAEFGYISGPVIREFVIKENEGKLYVTYENSSYYRSYTEISNKYGKVIGSGSAGAATHYVSEGYINGEGQYDFCYGLTVSYDGITLVEYDYDYDFSGAISQTGKDYSDTYLREYSFTETTDEMDEDRDIWYCAQKEADEESNGIDFIHNEELYEELFALAGAQLYSLDQVNAKIAEREASFGVRSNWKTEETPVEWKDVEVDISAINDPAVISKLNNTKIQRMNPSRVENFMYEGNNICHIYDELTHEKYHFSDKTILADGIPCYDGCDTMEWLYRYLTHSADLDEDINSPYYKSGIAIGDIWAVEVDDKNNIIRVLGVYYWD